MKVLAKGRTVYYGQASSCERLFQLSFNQNCEAGTSAVDWVMDLIHDSIHQVDDNTPRVDQLVPIYACAGLTAAGAD